jgi:hypothetical protein
MIQFFRAATNRSDETVAACLDCLGGFGSTVLLKAEARVSPSALLSIALALMAWAIFYPGILSVDSLYTYREALTGQFSDIRPPLLAFVLLIYLKTGGTLASFILLESLLGFLGVRLLLMAVMRLFPEPDGSIRREVFASVGLLLLSSPLTPMPIYFVTLWFDSWLVILLLWTLALLVEISMGTAKDSLRIGTLIILTSLVMLIRWNALVLYAPLAVAMYQIFSDKGFSHRARLGLAGTPLAICLLFFVFQYQVIGVRRAHNERVAFALDLASMIVSDAALCQDLPLESCHTIEGRITKDFIVGRGAIDHTLNQGLGTMEPAFLALASSPSLVHDLWLAATHRPVTYVRVKLLNFWDSVCPRDRYYFQAFMHPNNLNLSFNTRFEMARAKYLSMLHAVYEQPVLRFFSFVPLPWILINLTGIAACLRYKHRSEMLRSLSTLLYIPATYTGTYLLALTASDLRFLYPAMLLVQVILIGVVPAWWAANNRSRQPTSAVGNL